jgi:uncharacterized iron-regulated membrane protein
VAVNPQSGKIIASYDAVNGPLANRITDNLYTIHTGEAGGLVARLLVLFDGLLLPAFFVTGFVTWRRRSAARKTAAAKQRKSEQREILPVPANAGDVAADRAA